jgi:predicted nucleotidyltransferase
MRLTSYQETIIKKLTAEIFGSDARLMLFGSRVDDTKKGGDIDLYIETQDSKMVLNKNYSKQFWITKKKKRPPNHLSIF